MKKFHQMTQQEKIRHGFDNISRKTNWLLSKINYNLKALGKKSLTEYKDPSLLEPSQKSCRILEDQPSVLKRIEMQTRVQCCNRFPVASSDKYNERSPSTYSKGNPQDWRTWW